MEITVVAVDVVVEGSGASQIACSLSGGHEQGPMDAGVKVELLHCSWRRCDIMETVVDVGEDVA